MTRVDRHLGWEGDNILVRDARLPFARRVAGLLGADLPSDLRIAAGVDTRGFHTYPLLFYPAFPHVSLAQLRALSVSGSYLFDYVLCLDDLFDGRASDQIGAILLAGELHRAALSGLHTLFPYGSAFWRHFEAYAEHFCRAVREETAHRGVVRPYRREELEMIYSGKAAVAKSCLAALAVLDGSPEKLPPLVASHDAFYVAFQLLDDLVDWHADYARGHYSYPLTLALERSGSAVRPEPAQMGRLVAAVADEIRELALRHLDRAAAPFGEPRQGTWGAAIRATRDRVGRFRFDPDPVAP